MEDEELYEILAGVTWKIKEEPWSGEGYTLRTDANIKLNKQLLSKWLNGRVLVKGSVTLLKIGSTYKIRATNLYSLAEFISNNNIRVTKASINVILTREMEKRKHYQKLFEKSSLYILSCEMMSKVPSNLQ